MNIITLLTPKEDTFYLDSRSTIRQALEKYDYHKFTVVPLIDKEGHYITTLSEGDILRYIKNNSNFDLEIAEAQSIKPSRTDYFISKSDFKKAMKLMPLKNIKEISSICRGPSYIYAILMDKRICG